jgi:predicted phage terminase large subunit-like protein
VNNIEPKLLQRLLDDSQVRSEVTKNSHNYFFGVYLGEYIKYKSSVMHGEMMELTERTDVSLSIITAFRGSAKSTIFSLSYPIWAILGKQQKKFVLIISKTQSQSRQILQNIKVELERNELLRHDLGPFEEPDDEWRASSIVLSQYDARIMVISADQSMRGLRHRSSRPDLIICDDIEDIASTRTQEGRDKTFNWFTSEIIPAGDVNTKIILIGNLVHDDSLIMRLREKIDDRLMDGEFKAFPLINSEGECSWKEKFPDEASLETLRRKVASQQAWEREYLLKIIPDDDQIIDPIWIRYYFSIPHDVKIVGVFVGVDLAISKNTYADYTAMVPILVCEKESKLHFYVLPEIVHKRINFSETHNEILYLNMQLEAKYGIEPIFLIESVAYQQAVIDSLEEKNIKVEGVRPQGSKRERLALTTATFSDKRIFFPQEKAKELIQELVHFGSEKHDDLADAFSMTILEVLVNRKPRKSTVFFA